MTTTTEPTTARATAPTTTTVRSTIETEPAPAAHPVMYFAGSIRAGRDDVDVYAALVADLKRYGDVITEHVGDYSLSLHGQAHLTDKHIHDRDLGWLRRSDVVVAEVTTPSLGVGYEIATAIAWRIPVIGLYRGDEGRLSAMIAGSDGVELTHYTELREATDVIAAAFARLGFEGEK